MYAVVFGVWPTEGRREDYLKLAASLRAEVEKIDGFLSVERFQSLYDQGKLLSLQFWRDEEAILKWREHLEHRRAQKLGREVMFADYRLRIAKVERDYGPRDRAEAPEA